ncbi:unnamed protein product, partial [Prorocentrum cordatum]
ALRMICDTTGRDFAGLGVAARTLFKDKSQRSLRRRLEHVDTSFALVRRTSLAMVLIPIIGFNFLQVLLAIRMFHMALMVLFPPSDSWTFIVAFPNRVKQFALVHVMTTRLQFLLMLSVSWMSLVIFLTNRVKLFVLVDLTTACLQFVMPPLSDSWMFAATSLPNCAKLFVLVDSAMSRFRPNIPRSQIVMRLAMPFR